MRWFSWGPIFDVTDADEQPLGRVEERFSWFFPTFEIISAANIIQAQATLNFLGTTYTISDPLSKLTIATMHRNFIRLKDDWKVKIIDRELYEQKNIDPRLFIVVMAFQSDMDDIKSESKSNYQAKSMKKITEHGDGQDRMNALRAQLEYYRDLSMATVPTEEDFESVDRMVTWKMNEENSFSTGEESKITYLERGFAALIPIFEENELSPDQKAALFVMLEKVLDRSEPLL